ncbi:MAG TPA: hypothetical protein VJV74_04440, partial [Terriglobia bacterium]|nr:hypothetical protein [Terriglobia bacterium]
RPRPAWGDAFGPGRAETNRPCLWEGPGHRPKMAKTHRQLGRTRTILRLQENAPQEFGRAKSP